MKARSGTAGPVLRGVETTEAGAGKGGVARPRAAETASKDESRRREPDETSSGYQRALVEDNLPLALTTHPD
jgi:hypothetical protein